MSDSIFAPMEAALLSAPGNAALASAYVQTGVALGAAPRVAEYLASSGFDLATIELRHRLDLAQALLQSGDFRRLATLALGEEPELGLLRARALLAIGQRADAQRAYGDAVARNPAIEDATLSAELDGRVVRLGSARPLAREPSIANDDTDSADVVRLIQPEVQRVKFSDVGGLDEIKKQIRRRIITPFQKPSLFERFKRSSGGGVLLYGPPGCGKTLLARATAGECGASFYNVSVSDVLDMYIGESERKLHAVFEQARRTRPSVVFFDEVEALGGKRQYSREATSAKLVSQFLSELDGFAQNNSGVLILAATNVPWAVDPAFRRPGRFDRVLFVPPPDAAARAEILRELIATRPLDGAIDVEFVARATGGFSGADLRDLVDSAVDEAIERSIEAGREVPLTDALIKTALRNARATTLEWLTTARNYARYANEGGQYDDVLEFLKRHSQA